MNTAPTKYKVSFLEKLLAPIDTPSQMMDKSDGIPRPGEGAPSFLRGLRPRNSRSQ